RRGWLAGASPGPAGFRGGRGRSGGRAGRWFFAVLALVELLPRTGRVRPDVTARPRGEGAGRYRAPPRQLRSSNPHITEEIIRHNDPAVAGQRPARTLTSG